MCIITHNTLILCILSSMINFNYKLLLKELRKENGWTQKEVAEKLGTSQQNYQRYETGQIEPDIRTLIMLSIIFDVSLNEIICFNRQ